MKMEEALENYERAKKIGLCGKNTALDNFDHKKQMNRLIRYFNSL